MKSKTVSMKDMYPVMKDIIENGGEVSIIATGSSMEPLFHDGRDTIILTGVHRRLKKYDLPLYRRKNGAFVLHRVVKVLEDDYVMCGDNQVVLEGGISDNEVIAIVKGFIRKNKRYSADDKIYRLYSVLWVKSIWLRKKYRGLKRRIKHLIYH